MKENLRTMLSALFWALILLAAYGRAAQAQTGATANPHPAARQSVALQATGANLPVQGNGTMGRLTKWTGLTSSNSLIGDTTIFESKTGLVGIGTDTPTSRLTVQGMIETTLGGYKFPDGTVQTTAAVSGLQSIFHDATLTGNGTQGSPLGIALPLTLSGSFGSSVLTVIGKQCCSPAVSATSADDSQGFSPGPGIKGKGGNDTTASSGNTFGGDGVWGVGGDSAWGTGGVGVRALGGQGLFSAGDGIKAQGANVLSGNADGGRGVIAVGGSSSGANGLGGTGIFAKGGDGYNGAGPGRAGVFVGAVEVNGNFSVTGGGTKNFKIDHPLDPENKYLYHAAIESAEVLNIYSGNITTDESGEAVVSLPVWFEAINKDFRYQLTVLGQFAQAMVADEIKDHQFKIKTNAAGVKVSWQVTGIRSDAAMLKHPFKVEEEKPQSERGFYLTPEAYGQPEERGVEWARNSQMMQQFKQQQTEAEQLLKRRKASDR